MPAMYTWLKPLKREVATAMRLGTEAAPSFLFFSNDASRSRLEKDCGWTHRVDDDDNCNCAGACDPAGLGDDAFEGCCLGARPLATMFSAGALDGLPLLDHLSIDYAWASYNASLVRNVFIGSDL